jgi:RND family efflux transporter MFP subunit
VALCGLAAACSGQAESKNPEQGPRRVQVVKAELRPIPRMVVAVGTLAAEESAELGFKVPGRLARWNVDLGSRVAAGAVLDPRSVGIVRQAAARRDEATASLNRGRELKDQGILSQAEFDTLEAAFEVAQSQHSDALEEVNLRRSLLAERRSDLALAEQQVLNTRLLAPFAGGVQARRASLGEYLAAGAPVLALVKVNPLRLRLDVPEREAPSIRKGQDVTVSVEGETSKWSGKVVRISPALEESNRSLIVEAEVDNGQGLLRPGSFARAEIVTESGKDSLVVPASSVVLFAGIEKVVTVKDGKAQERPVTTGRHVGDLVEIVSGLEAGEPVVDKPGNLQTGEAVAAQPAG